MKSSGMYGRILLLGQGLKYYVLAIPKCPFANHSLYINLPDTNPHKQTTNIKTQMHYLGWCEYIVIQTAFDLVK